MQRPSPRFRSDVYISYMRYPEKYFTQIFGVLYGNTMLVPIQMVACVASVSNRVIARTLERKPLPRHSFFFAPVLSQLSRRTSRGNACYAGYPNGHERGERKPTETSVNEFCYKSVNFLLQELINIKSILFSRACFSRTRENASLFFSTEGMLPSVPSGDRGNWR